MAKCAHQSHLVKICYNTMLVSKFSSNLHLKDDLYQ